VSPAGNGRGGEKQDKLGSPVAAAAPRPRHHQDAEKLKLPLQIPPLPPNSNGLMMEVVSLFLIEYIICLPSLGLGSD